MHEMISTEISGNFIFDLGLILFFKLIKSYTNTRTCKVLGSLLYKIWYILSPLDFLLSVQSVRSYTFFSVDYHQTMTF